MHKCCAMDEDNDVARLVRCLVESAEESLQHEVVDLRLTATHISYVVLTGLFVYKFKKPVDLGFLDFSTIQARRHSAIREIQYNRKFSPEIYEGIVAVDIQQDGTVIVSEVDEQDYYAESWNQQEFAVKMKQFQRENEFTKLHEQQKLTEDLIIELAETIYKMHSTAEEAHEYGSLDLIWFHVEQNFQQINEKITNELLLERVKALEIWSNLEFDRLKDYFLDRQANHFIRGCHGDLHMGNVTIFKDHVHLFDCIEFNEKLRNIDTQSDLAFMLMDLEEHKETYFSYLLLNSYLSKSGDYNGLRGLVFYKVYRALIRAKISLMKSVPNIDDFLRYLELSEYYVKPRSPVLILMNGLSGSGKTGVASTMAAYFGAIQIRSDLERKRLFGVDPENHSFEEKILYSMEATEKTFNCLYEMSEKLLSWGYSVILDATFLEDSLRSRFHGLWADYAIVRCEAPIEVLEERVSRREREASDASDADNLVLHRQIDRLAETDIFEVSADRLICVDTSIDGFSDISRLQSPLEKVKKILPALNEE